jgi:hypothetical protein
LGYASPVRAALCLPLVLLSACPVPTDGTTPTQPQSAIEPDACGSIQDTKIGRKIYAFLIASAELDTATAELEGTVREACGKMAIELGSAPTGSTKELCDRVTDDLKANLQVSVSQEQRLVTRTVPPVCTTDVDFAAKVAAECEATVEADVQVSCSGRCGGTCEGRCDGTCDALAADGVSCAGQCRGTCQGSCRGSCDGYANVDASAECRASAEIRADVRTTCTEPRVEVVTENVTVVDATKLQKAVRAIEVGLPVLLKAGARAKVVAKALVHWTKVTAQLVRAGSRVLREIGKRGACVALQVAAAAAASVQIEARIEVSVNVSASVSGAAGASSQ